MHRRSGQVILEYAIVVVIAATALATMSVYTRRGVQAGIKTLADRMSPHSNDPHGERAQLDGVRYESRDRQDKVVGTGTTLARVSQINNQVEQETDVTVEENGKVVTTFVKDTSATTGKVAQVGDQVLPAGISDYSEAVLEVKPR